MNRTIMICLSVLLLVLGLTLRAGGQAKLPQSKARCGCCEQCGTKCTAESTERPRRND